MTIHGGGCQLDRCKIKELREKSNMSIRKLASQSGVSYSYLSLLESGKKDNPSAKVLKKIAQALGVEGKEIF